ncbi:MAG: helix-turn-helix transcriptional regulator [Oscillospiraceae bacterium]|nr:helix-turn-helix transcriptional regulator [Oscillospiraceae bacterium]
MNQQRTGEFLKHLRKDKGLTQAQLAEHFGVSARTVSRWETGSNMPDVEMLIDIADFYDVDIRELIDGERKSGNASNQSKDTLKKVAEYSSDLLLRQIIRGVLGALTGVLLVIALYFILGV